MTSEGLWQTFAKSNDPLHIFRMFDDRTPLYSWRRCIFQSHMWPLLAQWRRKCHSDEITMVKTLLGFATYWIVLKKINHVISKCGITSLQCISSWLFHQHLFAGLGYRLSVWVCTIYNWCHLENTGISGGRNKYACISTNTGICFLVTSAYFLSISRINVSWRPLN